MRAKPTTLCHKATLAPHRGSEHAAPRALVPGVSRPRSLHVHRCGPISLCTPQRSTRLLQASSVKAGPPGLEPKRRLTNNSATASSVSASAQRPRNSWSSLPSDPWMASLAAATRYEARLARLPLSAFVWLNTSTRSRRRSYSRPRTSAKTPGTLELCSRHRRTHAGTLAHPAWSRSTQPEGKPSR